MPEKCAKLQDLRTGVINVRPRVNQRMELRDLREKMTNEAPPGQPRDYPIV